MEQAHRVQNVCLSCMYDELREESLFIVDLMQLETLNLSLELLKRKFTELVMLEGLNIIKYNILSSLFQET
jgi:hypothetical protein